jgi:radical SAM protein with 4Fe4S-binding SPASM domain
MRILCPLRTVGLQKKKEDTAYRLMHYVVKQEVEEGVLLYNTLTCAMVLVTHEEAQHLTEVEGLIENWFLVPVEHQDKKFCKFVKYGISMRQKRPKGIRKYTVVTTTGCNARCPYCFEKGTKPVNMTMETAEKVARYIISHRGEHEKVEIDWFGGEPLYNFKVMDRICTRLLEHEVNFFSCITTNGYLFNEKMVEKAVQLWHLNRVLITVDGTEQNYNRIKAYIHRNEPNPFERVMANIGMLLKAGMKVKVRLHVSIDNVQDIENLIQLLADRFKGVGQLSLQILHLFELFGPEAKVLSSEERATLVGEIRRLKKYACQLGISKMKGLRREMKLWRCMVDSEDAVMIVPDGRLGFCEHHLEDRFFGDIDHEEWDMDVVRQSREYCEEIAECDTCALYPVCYRLKICGISDRCFKESRESELLSIQEQMLKKYRELNGVLY